MLGLGSAPYIRSSNNRVLHIVVKPLLFAPRVFLHHEYFAVRESYGLLLIFTVIARRADPLVSPRTYQLVHRVP